MSASPILTNSLMLFSCRLAEVSKKIVLPRLRANITEVSLFFFLCEIRFFFSTVRMLFLSQKQKM